MHYLFTGSEESGVMKWERNITKKRAKKECRIGAAGLRAAVRHFCSGLKVRRNGASTLKVPEEL